jgi:nucleoside phosphorylase/NTP pyrophosphatase (non-canonical NTP hydrolase)
MTPADDLSLDDLYHMQAHIYFERNAERPISATFAHFVEVCGMLTIHGGGKKREGLTPEGVLCKALGWYFPLMAKLGVRSIEELVFRKYPYACPYCRLCPHNDVGCKQIEGSTRETVNHAALTQKFAENRARRPRTLDQWRQMFNDIYPRTPNDRSARRSVNGLFEEIGELAEAIRVFERHPKYVAGEAADVFSYLMGIANEIYLEEKKDGRLFSLQDSFVRSYPGLCVQCGDQVCSCPVVPEATVGRLAKELDVRTDEILFGPGPLSDNRGSQVAEKVLRQLGGYCEIARQFPFDRGEANRALILLCLNLANDLERTRPETSQKLRAAAVTIASSTTSAGSKQHNDRIVDAITSLREVWPLIDSAVKQDQSLSIGIGNLLETFSVQSCRFGIVTALPKECAAMRAMFEESRDYPIKGDPNEYVVGTIPSRDGEGAHVVVLTLLKEKGNNSAAAVAANLLRSFQGIQDVLMVGIAGGAPNPRKVDRHVRLGDVVVSNEYGLVQFDNIRIETGNVTILDTSSKPSARLLGKVNMLEAKRLAGERPWERYLERATKVEGATRPGSGHDILHDTTNPSEIIPHPDDTGRRDGLPKLFYGRIGAANVLLKNPRIRDLVRDKCDVRAFEMEGSGIADGTWTAGQKYMLIRGICDYCDEYKSDEWQGYAAIAAAAYARALLEAMPFD